MSLLVVDASVVIKWFVPELHSERAGRLLAEPHDFLAPDLLFPEVGNVIWKKVRRGELTDDLGRRLVADLATIAVETVSTRGLLREAHAIAVSVGVTVYDAMYVALAVRVDTQVVTADDRLARAVAAHPMLAAHVQRLQASA